MPPPPVPQAPPVVTPQRTEPVVAAAPPPAQPLPLPPAPTFGSTGSYSQPHAPLSVGQVAYGSQPSMGSPARTVSPVLAALGAAAGTIALLALLYIFVLPHRGDADATAKPVSADTPKLETAGTAASGKPHPLAKHIEVGGVRIQEQSGGKVRIDFVVVNHSSADLPPLKMDVRLASGGREYFVIPVDLPSVGPFESKELSTSVKTNLKPYELPDWQLVQAKFAVRD